MRTTLTIDDDIAVALERLRKTRDASLKELINEALRRGLKEMSGRSKPHTRFQTKTADLGQPLLTSIDNVVETLAVAERETFK